MITEKDAKPVGEQPAPDLNQYLRFIVPSLVGIFLFLTPIVHNGEYTILLGAIADETRSLIGENMRYFTVFFFVMGGLLTALVNAVPRFFNDRFPALFEIFTCSVGWLVLRLAGAIFAAMTLLQLGPEWVVGGDTGGTAYVDVAGVVFLMIGLGCLLLPFLTDFGFMEFIGTLLRGVFQRAFKLPGRAAVDTLASWVGASSIAILVTSDQYAKGYYSAREAAVISTNFSVVSIPFVVVIAEVAGISHLFLPLYAVMLFIGIICALVTPRLPPLSLFKDDYYAPIGRQIKEEPNGGVGKYQWALVKALERAKAAPGPLQFLKSGLLAAADLFLTMMPVAMTFMFVALVIFHHTQLFQITAVPLVPLLELMQIPEAEVAAPGIFIGLFDQFVPAIIAGSIDNDLTSFILAGLSVTQLIFFAETAVLILRSKIPLSILQLVSIFVLRTVIALPILTLTAHWLVSK